MLRFSLGELMALFFDADWFDQTLAARGTDRIGLAVAAGIDRGELHGIFTNERSPTAKELAEFARILETDLLEITIRSGVAVRESAPGDDEGGAPAVIADEFERCIAPATLALVTPEQSAGDRFVAVAEDVGLDHEDLADGALDRKTSAIELRTHA
jgi:hypothetical protein